MIRATYDNSAQNPPNPDPTRWVRWGRASEDEMLLAYLLYHETEPKGASERERG